MTRKTDKHLRVPLIEEGIPDLSGFVPSDRTDVSSLSGDFFLRLSYYKKNKI